MTAKKTAAKRPAKKATPAKRASSSTTRDTLPDPAEDRQATKASQALEAYEARVRDASEALDTLEATITQREWLLITTRLDRSREQIAKDGALRLLALGWVREKREHGGASWDRLLEMTDDELLALADFPTEDPPEA